MSTLPSPRHSRTLLSPSTNSVSSSSIQNGPPAVWGNPYLKMKLESTCMIIHVPTWKLSINKRLWNMKICSA
eukprot:g44297.t1